MRRITICDQGHGCGGRNGSGGQVIIWTGVQEYGSGNFNAKGDGQGYGGIWCGDGYDHGFETGNGDGEGYA